jgi:hypothetical protein
MARAKELAKRFFIGCGRLTSKAIKGTANFINEEYERYQRRKRIEEERNQELRRIEEEAYIEERGRQRAIVDVRERERARREEERYFRGVSRNFERQVTDVPKVNEDFWTQDFYPKKRKKRR